MKNFLLFGAMFCSFLNLSQSNNVNDIPYDVFLIIDSVQRNNRPTIIWESGGEQNYFQVYDNEFVMNSRFRNSLVNFYGEIREPKVKTVNNSKTFIFYGIGKEWSLGDRYSVQLTELTDGHYKLYCFKAITGTPHVYYAHKASSFEYFNLLKTFDE